MEKPFQFKLFKVEQNLAAMKVGTDAVLLGAWTEISDLTDSILDVGSGTGVIALMMAQRSNALTIDAVEINENAYLQSVINFENSIWSDRLYCYHSSFENFAVEFSSVGEKYDLIISNPPFYKNAFHTKNEDRNASRSEHFLSFSNLLMGVSKLLSNNGIFSTIIPYESELDFIALAKENGLFVCRICRVKGNHLSKFKRSLLSFSFTKKSVEQTQLIIEEERHQYTQEYSNLTKDFYLKM